MVWSPGSGQCPSLVDQLPRSSRDRTTCVRWWRFETNARRGADSRVIARRLSAFIQAGRNSKEPSSTEPVVTRRTSHPNPPSFQVDILDIEPGEFAEAQSVIGQQRHHIALGATGDGERSETSPAALPARSPRYPKGGGPVTIADSIAMTVFITAVSAVARKANVGSGYLEPFVSPRLELPPEPELLPQLELLSPEAEWLPRLELPPERLPPEPELLPDGWMPNATAGVDRDGAPHASKSDDALEPPSYAITLQKNVRRARQRARKNAKTHRKMVVYSRGKRSSKADEIGQSSIPRYCHKQLTPS
jgi:hypothetical protein